MRSVFKRGAGWAVAALLALVAAGCGPGVETHPVNGKVVLEGGDVSALGGCYIDAALEGVPAVRASGEIQADGSFALETLHEGAIIKGAKPGRYRVRLVLNDDDRAARKRAAKALARRFRSFDTSGLSLDVPVSGEPRLEVSAR